MNFRMWKVSFRWDEVTEYSKTIGLMPVRVQELPEAKHIFSHIEWHMTGYEVIVDELEKTNEKGFLFYFIRRRSGRSIRFRRRLKSIQGMRGLNGSDRKNNGN